MSDFSSLTVKNVPVLWKTRKEIFCKECVDFAGLQEIDSAGIAFLVQWSKSLSPKKLRIMNITDEAFNLVATFRLQPLFEIAKQ